MVALGGGGEETRMILVKAMRVLSTRQRTPLRYTLNTITRYYEPGSRAMTRTTHGAFQCALSVWPIRAPAPAETCAIMFPSVMSHQLNVGTSGELIL